MFKFFVALFFVITFAHSAEFKIKTKSKEYSFSGIDLLKRSDVEKIEIFDDPAYPGMKMTYTAVKVVNLFKGIHSLQDAVYEFYTLDGFSAPIETKKLFNTNKLFPVGYVAIEEPGKQWPALKGKKESAGPFYLVWINGKKSKASKEEWPFMLAGFEVKDSLNSIYPDIFPKGKFQKESPVMKGFEIFKENCFACHTMNKNGSSQMGPDLNLPKNPTEYFSDATLKTLIRNPQNVRFWPNAKMPGFGVDTISEQDLNFLLTYLKQMASQKN